MSIEKQEFEAEVISIATTMTGKLREAQDTYADAMRESGRSEAEIAATLVDHAENWLRESMRDKLCEVTHQCSSDLGEEHQHLWHNHVILRVKLINAALVDIDFSEVHAQLLDLPEMK